MISKKEIKYLASLKQKKFRTINDEYLIEGEKLILDALKHKQPIKKIIYSKKGQHFDTIRKKSKILKIELCLSTEKDAQKISDTKNSQQIFALLKCIQLNHLNLVVLENNNLSWEILRLVL